MILALLLLLQDPAAMASAAMREHRYPEAVQIYRGLTQQDSVWRLNLGMALSYADQHNEAASELTAYLRERPQPGAAHLFLGVSYLKLNKPCDAIEPLELALQWPQRPVSRWAELADAYQGCKRWEPAARAFAEAAKIDRLNADKLARQTAHCWRMARRYDLAKPEFAALVSAYADNAEFQFEYGDTLMRLDGAESGLPWLEKAAKQLLPARAAFGRALMELNRPADAITHLEAAAKEDPAVLLPLSRAYRALHRDKEAADAEAAYKARILN